MYSRIIYFITPQNTSTQHALVRGKTPEALDAAINKFVQTKQAHIVALLRMPDAEEIAAVRTNDRYKTLLRNLADDNHVMTHGICRVLCDFATTAEEGKIAATIIQVMRSFEYARPSAGYFVESLTEYSTQPDMRWKGVRGDRRRKFCQDAYDFFFNDFHK